MKKTSDFHELTTLNDQVALYIQQGKYDQAEPLCLHALAIAQETLGVNHIDLAVPLRHLAILYNRQGKHREAESLYLRTLALSEQHLKSHQIAIANDLHNIAVFYHSTSNFSKAEFFYLRTLAMRDQLLGIEHIDTQATMTSYIALLRELGRTNEAVKLEMSSRKSDV